MVYVITDGHCNSTIEWCIFDTLNGVMLSTIGVGGVLLNLLVLYIMLASAVPLPGKQKIFMVNLALADLYLSLAGTQRGLGLISPKLMIGGAGKSLPCVMFAFTLNFVGYINSCALIPITIERFVAIVMPFKLTKILCKRNCILLCIATWVPNVLFMLVELVSYHRAGEGDLKIIYLPNYNRCIYRDYDLEVLIKGIICFMIPVGIIIVVYASIFVVMVRKKIETRRVLAISLLIVLTGVMSWAPSLIIQYASIMTSYEVSHIVTITLFYVIGVTDPVIYMCGYRNIRAFLRGKKYYRKYRALSISTHCGRQDNNAYVRNLKTIHTYQPLARIDQTSSM